VFVVGCLGGWESAAKVLFESESLSGDIAKGKRKKQETSRSFIPNIANTLQTTCNDYSRADGFNMIAYENHPSDSRVKEMGETCQTVTSTWGMGGGNIPFVQKTYALQGAGSTSQNANGNGYKEEQSYTLNVTDVHGVATNMAVRRLTEVECERLQGFPDNYTNIKENCPSGARYKALGNSMAVPVMRWIGERINNYERL
jgi:DNA (cytosine-5)-methyltransferase 1